MRVSPGPFVIASRKDRSPKLNFLSGARLAASCLAKFQPLKRTREKVFRHIALNKWPHDEFILPDHL